MVENPLDSKKHPRKNTLFSRMRRMLEKTFPFLHPVPQGDSLLLGRIREVQQKAEGVLLELYRIKKELRNELDDELYVFVENVINPLIREIGRIEKQRHRDPESSHTFRRYSEWIAKAKLWVQLDVSHYNKETLSQFIVHHSLQDFIELIERDLRLIKDYEEQSFTDMVLEKKDQKNLKKRLDFILKPYLSSLISLKQAPADLSLKELIIWRESVDRRRDRYYNRILQLIDNNMAEVSPPLREVPLDLLHDYTHLNVQEVEDHLEHLEQNVPRLMDTMWQKKSLAERHALMAQLISLEEEVDILYLDMRLSTEIADRLHVLKKLLERALHDVLT